MKHQKGYTLYELFIVLYVLALLAGIGLTIWVLWHFISKFW